MNKLSKTLLLGMILALLVAPFALAFGVTRPYWDEKPLVMAPGESRSFDLSLQNMVGGEDMTFQASVVKGDDIATIDKDRYAVPFGENNVRVKVTVNIPADAELGKTREVGVSFVQVSDDEGQTVQLSGGIQSFVPVLIQEPEVEEPVVEEESTGYNTQTTALIILALIIIVVAYLYFANTKKKNK